MEPWPATRKRISLRTVMAVSSVEFMLLMTLTSTAVLGPEHPCKDGVALAPDRGSTQDSMPALSPSSPILVAGLCFGAVFSQITMLVSANRRAYSEAFFVSFLVFGQMVVYDLLLSNGSLAAFCVPNYLHTGFKLEVPARYAFWLTSTQLMVAIMAEEGGYSADLPLIANDVVILTGAIGAFATYPRHPLIWTVCLAISCAVEAWTLYLMARHLGGMSAGGVDQPSRDLARYIGPWVIIARFFFPVFWFCATFGLVGGNAEQVIWPLLEALAKLPFAILLLAGEYRRKEARMEEQLEQLEKERITADAAASARRSILRYLFHECRVPLSSIVMGADELADALNLGSNGSCSAGGDGGSTSFSPEKEAALATAAGAEEIVSPVKGAPAALRNGGPSTAQRVSIGKQMGELPRVSPAPAASAFGTQRGGKKKGGTAVEFSLSPLSLSAPAVAPASNAVSTTMGEVVRNSASFTLAPATETIGPSPALLTSRGPFDVAGSPASHSTAASTASTNGRLSTGSRSAESPLLGGARRSSLVQTVDYIRSSARVMSKLLDDFLSIEKIDEGKLELEVSDYDPRALVRQSAYIFSQPLRRKGIQLLVEVRPEVPPTARGDASRLRQVISNYLSNAIKFSPEGTNIILRASLARRPVAPTTAATDGGHKREPSTTDSSRSGRSDVTVDKPAGDSDSFAAALGGASDSRGSRGAGTPTRAAAGGGGRGGAAVSSALSIAKRANDAFTNCFWGGLEAIHRGVRDASRSPTKTAAAAASGNIVQAGAGTILTSTASGTRASAAGAAAAVNEEEEAEDQSEAMLLVEVIDQGPGLSPEEQAKLFQPFQQIRAASTQGGGGTGLGLSICRKIISLSGGVLGVRSNTTTSASGDAGEEEGGSGKGKGCTFYFMVPLIAKPPTAAPPQVNHTDRLPVRGRSLSTGSAGSATTTAEQAAATPAAAVIPAPAAVQYTIPPASIAHGQPVPLTSALVVDDVTSNRELLIRLLKRKGVTRVTGADDGDTAVEAIRQRMGAATGTNGGEDVAASATASSSSSMLPPQCILMDCEMPRLDGREATKQIRRMGYCGAIVGLTGNALLEDQQALLAAGADAVLPKPVRWELLSQQLTGLGFTFRATGAAAGAQR